MGLGVHQLKRSVTNDARLHTTFTLSMAALKFNMAAAIPEVVLTSAPEAILTPLQRELCVPGTHKLNRSVTSEAVLKFVVVRVGILGTPFLCSEL